jgi:hypothetical protein
MKLDVLPEAKSRHVEKRDGSVAQLRLLLGWLTALVIGEANVSKTATSALDEAMDVGVELVAGIRESADHPTRGRRLSRCRLA